MNHIYDSCYHVSVVTLKNCDIAVVFLRYYGQFAAISKGVRDTWSIKLTFSLTLTFCLTKTKTELKNLWHRSNTIALSKGAIFAKKYLGFGKNADISKIKWSLVVKGIFSKTKYACVLT